MSGRSMLVWIAAAALMAPPALASEEGRRRGRVERVEVGEPDMALVPAGTFPMGFPDNEEEQRDFELACRAQLPERFADEYCTRARYADALGPREVYLHAFEIDRHEVTVREYRACVAAGACDLSPLMSGDTRFARDELPIVNVTWQDAVDFCAWEGKRLPTEAEWEKAARGTDGRRWPWGNQERDDGANHGGVESEAVTNRFAQFPAFIHDGSDGAKYLVPPGTMQWGESPYGVHDLAGNAGEWVADFYHDDGYVGLPIVDPVQSTPQDDSHRDRVYRGGSWVQPKMFARPYIRSHEDPNKRSFDIGFRCVRDLR